MDNQQSAIKPLRISDFFVVSNEEEILLRLDDLKRFTYFSFSVGVYGVDLTVGESQQVFLAYAGVVFNKPWKNGREFAYDYDAVVSGLEKGTLDAYKILELNHDFRLALIRKVEKGEYGDMMNFVRRFERHARRHGLR